MGDVKAAYNRMAQTLKENFRNITLYPEFGSDLTQILKFTEEKLREERGAVDVEFEIIKNENENGDALEEDKEATNKQPFLFMGNFLEISFCRWRPIEKFSENWSINFGKIFGRPPSTSKIFLKIFQKFSRNKCD